MQGTSSAGRRWPDFGTWWSIVITHAVIGSAWSRRCQTKHWQPYYRPQWRISLQRAVQWAEPRGCVRQQSSKPTGRYLPWMEVHAVLAWWEKRAVDFDRVKLPAVEEQRSLEKHGSLPVATLPAGIGEPLLSVSESEYLDGLRDQK